MPSTLPHIHTTPTEGPNNRIDPLILPLVQHLNYISLETTGSCQGHPRRYPIPGQGSHINRSGCPAEHSAPPSNLSDSYVVIAVRPYQIPVMASLAERLWTECGLPTGVDLAIIQSGALEIRPADLDRIRFDLILRYRPGIGEMPMEERQRAAIDAVTAVVREMAAGR